MSLDWCSVKALSIPVGGVSRGVKRVSVGGTVLWEKPNPIPYDAEIQYLETDGSAYIDTGIYLQSSTAISSTFSNCLAALGTQFFGARTALNSKMFAVQHNAISTLIFNYGTRQNLLYDVQTDNSQRTISVREGVLTYGAYTLAAGQTPAFATDYTAYIFCMNNGGTPTNRFAGLRCHALRIEQGNATVRDFTPVRVGSGANAVGYLYDRVSSALFGNDADSGAGFPSACVGPDKP